MPTLGRFSFGTASSAFLLCLLPACEVGAAPNKQSNVILICLDTVRADHLGCYGYEGNETTPALDALAENAIVFADASATAGWTKPSVPSFLTGTYPCQHGVYEGSARLKEGAVTDVLPDSATTLAEVFADAGWRTGAFVRNAQLRPGNGFEQGFESYMDEAGDAREIRWRAQDWLGEQEDDRPFFLYLHLLDAHWPYPVPDEYATRFASAEAVAPFRDGDSRALRDAINDGEVDFEAADREALLALYDGALRYIDDELGRLFAWLDRNGLEDTVICVISDHGEEFGEYGRIGHGHSLSENLLRVPWILRDPNSAPGRVEVPVSLVDLYPTLLATAGITAPGSEGLDRLREPNVARPVVAEHKAPSRYLNSLRAGDRKLVRSIQPVDRGPDPDAIPVHPGERWEVELQLEDGKLMALQLKPRDEDPDDPLEIKGVVSDLDGEAFSLVGIPIRLAPDTELQLTEDASDDTLRNGAFLKARCRLEEGVFVAERLKFYGPSSERELEIRGSVHRIEGTVHEGKVSFAGVEVLITASTVFKDVPTRRARMDRGEVVHILESGAGDLPVQRDTFSVIGFVESPMEHDSSLDQLLELRMQQLVKHRVFSTSDRILLTPEAIGRLQAIGYAE